MNFELLTSTSYALPTCYRVCLPGWFEIRSSLSCMYIMYVCLSIPLNDIRSSYIQLTVIQHTLISIPVRSRSMCVCVCVCVQYNAPCTSCFCSAFVIFAGQYAVPGPAAERRWLSSMHVLWERRARPVSAAMRNWQCSIAVRIAITYPNVWDIF